MGLSLQDNAAGTTAWQVQQILQEAEGCFVSGERVASRLGISRTAVWKAVRVLEDEGAAIEAAHRKGYRLVRAADILDARTIEQMLSPSVRDSVMLTLKPTTESTNSDARELAERGADAFTVVISGEQSAGRGRRGREFFSPKSAGLYLSMILRPDLSARDGALITGGAAVAASRAIEQVCDADVRIKWVNDLYVDDRKVCGILTEAASDLESGRINHAVVGIGVNVYEPVQGYPPQIANRAGAIARTPVCDLRSRLAAALVEQLHGVYTSADPKGFMDEYRARLMLSGRRIEVLLPDGNRFEAMASGIDDDMNLVVTRTDGLRIALSSAEVSIKL